MCHTKLTLKGRATSDVDILNLYQKVEQPDVILNLYQKVEISCVILNLCQKVDQLHMSYHNTVNKYQLHMSSYCTSSRTFAARHDSSAASRAVVRASSELGVSLAAGEQRELRVRPRAVDKREELTADEARCAEDADPHGAAYITAAGVCE